MLSEALEFAGDAFVVMPTRRFVKYDRVREQPLDSHRPIKHGATLAETLSQSLDARAIRLGYSDSIVVLFYLSINLRGRFWRSSSGRTLGLMRVILAAFIQLLTFRFRKRMSLELELVALRHHLLKDQFDALVHDESVGSDSIEKIFDTQFRRRFTELINRATERNSTTGYIDWSRR